MNRSRFNWIIFDHVSYDVLEFSVAKHTYVNMLHGCYLLIKKLQLANKRLNVIMPKTKFWFVFFSLSSCARFSCQIELDGTHQRPQRKRGGEEVALFGNQEIK